MYLALPSMTNQTSPVAILLQNRADFYKSALDRLPDAIMREQLAFLGEPQDIDFPELCSDDASSLSAALTLEDPLKKTGLGERWGVTVVSYVEFFDRAKSLEQLVVLVASTPEMAKLPTVGQLRFEAETRLKRLAELEDSLRYHRLRLLDA